LASTQPDGDAWGGGGRRQRAGQTGPNPGRG
jgi:hypothetical protein